MNLYGFDFQIIESFTFYISKNPKTNFVTVEDLRVAIRNKVEQKYGIGTNVVYLYSLVEGEITYPNCNGKDLYIGEATSNKKGINDRFYHINSDKTKTKGNNFKSNYTLSSFYHKEKDMQLCIFVLSKEVSRTILEDNLTRHHLIMYGALPIGTSAGGGKHTPKKLQAMIDKISTLK